MRWTSAAECSSCNRGTRPGLGAGHGGVRWQGAGAEGRAGAEPDVMGRAVHEEGRMPRLPGAAGGLL